MVLCRGHLCAACAHVAGHNNAAKKWSYQSLHPNNCCNKPVCSAIAVWVSLLTLVILPRFNNFTALTLESVDKQANYTIGLNDLLLFPELETQFELFETWKVLIFHLLRVKILKFTITYSITNTCAELEKQYDFL